MAGSYNHCVDKETGKLYVNEDLIQMVENLGDAYESIEEMYGMIWWLASRVAWDTAPDAATVAEIRASRNRWVEEARQNYQLGLTLSPGTDGHLPEDDECES